MTDCPGWELEAGDHRVLGQLSRLTKAASGRVSTGDPRRLAQRLHMDESAWRHAIVELKHSGFVQEVDGLLYLDTRCTCEQGEGLPSVGSEARKALQPGPVKDAGWAPLPPPRKSSRVKRARNRSGRSPEQTPYVVGGRDLKSVAITTTKDIDTRLSPSAKPLHTGRIKPRDVTSEPSQPPATTTAQLRSAFLSKWRAANVSEKVETGATRVLDAEGTGAFNKGLLAMRGAGMKPERILALMDVFMAMVLSGEIRIDKPPWRVFLSQRQALADRLARTERTGTAKGKLRGWSSDVLDGADGGVVEPDSPNDDRGER